MAVEEFLLQNAVVLSATVVAGLVVFALWAVLHSIRFERRLASAMDRQDGQIRDLERTLSRELADTREEMLGQVSRGQREEQRAILESGGRIFQGMERRFGELNEQLTEDAGDVRAALADRLDRSHQAMIEQLSEGRLAAQQEMSALRQSLDATMTQHRARFDERLGDALKMQQEGLATGMTAVSRQVNQALVQHGESLSRRIQDLTETIDQRLVEISGQVDRRLAEGFEKTTATFGKVLEHLSRIDEAQKKITELSGNVVGLQEILSDKRSRGAFGEVQLNALVENILPQGAYIFQHSLSVGTRVDCLLKLPPPTGNLAVDAKFPLESYQRMTDLALSSVERERAARQFGKDIRKHIHDIAGKYIIEDETADGAMMFIPAEAVFAEIHAHHPELVETARQQRVWMVSPTTMMAVLTTARSVLRDVATQEQVHVIRKYLHELSKDFGRFQGRMDKLSVHIAQAHQDVEDVHKSARRISGRFRKIEEVELDEIPSPGVQSSPESGG